MGKLIYLEHGHQTAIGEDMKVEAMRLLKAGWLFYTLTPDKSLGEQVVPEEIDTQKNYIALWRTAGG